MSKCVYIFLGHSVCISDSILFPNSSTLKMVTMVCPEMLDQLQHNPKP